MIKLTKPRTSKTLAINIAKIASAKLAETVLILELKNVESAPSDYFVICSTHSLPQTKAVFDEMLLVPFPSVSPLIRASLPLKVSFAVGLVVPIPI